MVQPFNIILDRHLNRHKSKVEFYVLDMFIYIHIHRNSIYYNGKLSTLLTPNLSSVSEDYSLQMSQYVDLILCQTGVTDIELRRNRFNSRLIERGN